MIRTIYPVTSAGPTKAAARMASVAWVMGAAWNSSKMCQQNRAMLISEPMENAWQLESQPFPIVLSGDIGKEEIE
jgi:tartrate dehydratase beta subunit/fumarate hydratase class I family protein